MVTARNEQHEPVTGQKRDVIKQKDRSCERSFCLEKLANYNTIITPL